jgi:uncharacterized protein
MCRSSKDIVISLWKAFSARDAEEITKWLCEDALWIAPPDNATARFLGASDRMKGRAAIVHFIVKDFPRAFARDVKNEIRGVYADGSTVIVETSLTATLANERAYWNDYCFIHEVRDGAVALIREYMDTSAGDRMFFGGDGRPGRAHPSA